jgi:glycosyltransferase involved in cell wall biosynthesis
LYKHQWLVVEGISLLRNKGFNITLDLIGGGTGPAQKLVDNAILEFDPDAQFVQQFEFLPHSELPGVLAQFDIFIFASSCENMPVTLVEAMAVGLPIACSNRGPMPEVLEDGGVYFDPENPNSIAEAVEQLVQSPALRTKFAGKAKVLSEQYNWKRGSDETFTFIEDIYKRFRN